jgi:hypothetical protein
MRQSAENRVLWGCGVMATLPSCFTVASQPQAQAIPYHASVCSQAKPQFSQQFTTYFSGDLRLAGALLSSMRLSQAPSERS